MNKLNFGEIITVLVDNRVEVRNLVGASLGLPIELGKVTTIKRPLFADYEEQGREDEDFYIIHLVDHDVYVKTIARVDSYGDNENYPYGYGKEVRPIVKPTTVFE